MGTNVRRCMYCDTPVPEGRCSCEECDKKHEVATHETRINLGDITYSRETVSLGPTGIELMHRGHIGRRAISCKFMPQKLQDQIREFVLKVEFAH